MTDPSSSSTSSSASPSVSSPREHDPNAPVTFQVIHGMFSQLLRETRATTEAALREAFANHTPQASVASHPHPSPVHTGTAPPPIVPVVTQNRVKLNPLPRTMETLRQSMLPPGCSRWSSILLPPAA
jgi:hypothetical protein